MTSPTVTRDANSPFWRHETACQTNNLHPLNHIQMVLDLCAAAAIPRLQPALASILVC